jgi:DNA-binding NarL/FixJ family response regulator
MGLAFRCRKNKGREIDVQSSAGEATDGETGVAKCEKQRPDIVLLHAVMMTLNGLDAFAKIKSSVHHQCC